jgi:hypothetical protein
VHHQRQHRGAVGNHSPREDPRAQAVRFERYGAVELSLRAIHRVPRCTCVASNNILAVVLAGNGFTVHVAGCEFLEMEPYQGAAVVADPPKKYKKILLPGPAPLVPLKPPYGLPHPRSEAKHPTNYKFVLQFNFHRPIDIKLWKRIKAPAGWRKCPTGRDAQNKYHGVRFQCRDLKHSLTPAELETLRAKLYMALEPTF